MSAAAEGQQLGGVVGAVVLAAVLVAGRQVRRRGQGRDPVTGGPTSDEPGQTRRATAG